MARESKAATEIELKLTADPKTLARLWQAPQLQGRGDTPPKIKELENVYYDTADLRLRKRGLAFRIRRDGTKFIQTVKTGDSEAGGLFSRGEWEGPVPSLEPQPDIVDDPQIRAALGLILPGELRAVFTTRVRREIQEVNGTDSLGRLKVIEAAFDQGQIEAAGSVQPLSEIELELIEGSPRALFELALSLQDIAPTQLETRSKSARGYALATQRKPAWHKGKLPALKPQTRVDDALAAIFESCLLHWTANEAAALDGSDPEGVHQMRVGLRRFRSAITLFSELLPAEQCAWLNGEARWALGELGPARDLDVFLAELLAPLEADRPEDKDLAVLHKAAEAHLAEAYARVRHAISDPRYTRFLLQLGGWLEDRAWHCAALTPAQAVWLDQPLITLANKLLSKRHSKTVRKGKNFNRLSTEKRHDLRIAMKKLRYTTEFFSSLYPAKTVQPYVKAMRGLQESLGHLNDVAVAEHLLADLTKVPRGKRRPAGLDQASGKVIGWYAHGVIQFEPEMRQTWKSFAKTRPFWQASKK